jgi:hypothetical protein
MCLLLVTSRALMLCYIHNVVPIATNKCSQVLELRVIQPLQR